MWTDVGSLIATFIVGFCFGGAYVRLRHDRKQAGKVLDADDNPHISRLDVFELPESMRPPPMAPKTPKKK